MSQEIDEAARCELAAQHPLRRAAGAVAISGISTKRSVQIGVAEASGNNGVGVSGFVGTVLGNNAETMAEPVGPGQTRPRTSVA
jgi:hypothetical protein